MSTQKTILDFLDFLVSKKDEVALLKDITTDTDKIRLFPFVIEDYNTLVDQSSIAIKSLQIDNFNLDELISILKEENRQLKLKTWHSTNFSQGQNSPNKEVKEKPIEKDNSKDKDGYNANNLKNYNHSLNPEYEFNSRSKLNNESMGSQSQYQEKGSDITFAKNDSRGDLGKKYEFEEVQDVNENEEEKRVRL